MEQSECLNPLITAIVQIAAMLVIAHLFHLVFKPLGIPGPISQILAGLVLSPSLLSRINKVRQFFLQDTSAMYYKIFALVSRILFMFLIGLQMDIPYMKLHYRLAGTIAFGGFLLSVIFGMPISFFFVQEFDITQNKVFLFLLVILTLANTASPVVVRLIGDLKFDTSEVGRLAIASSLIAEMSCVLMYSTFLALTSWTAFANAVISIFMTVGVVFTNRYLAKWFSGWNKSSMYISNAQVLLILVILLVATIIIEVSGFHSTFTSFLLGVMFPRKGKTTRTIFRKLTYSVHDFILPIYFGYMGFQIDATQIVTYRRVFVLFGMVLLSFASKILGTLAACHYLKMPRIKGTLLSFILNLKGNFELLLIDVEPGEDLTWWNENVHSSFLVVVVLNTLISGPIIAYILRKKESFFAHKNTSVEYLDPESEFRMLACAYHPRHASGQLVLTAALSGSKSTSITPYLMHLVELPKKHRKTELMYSQLEDGQFSDEEDYGGNDVLEINEAIDVFTTQSKIRIHQVKVVNTFASMYEDVCTIAEDLRVSLIILHFHKHQRIDGNMESGREGYRATNQKILRHAPCSIGILVHKIQTGFQHPIGFEKIQHVATLFFGGPDDREALACSKRMASNTNIKLTLIRFLPAESSHKVQKFADAKRTNNELWMSLTKNESEFGKDDACVQEFRDRYVNPGIAGYAENFVNGGVDTMATLKDVVDLEFSLFIVGKGGGGRSHMTTGMSDWEECPELGTVGDLLASTELNLQSSILVIQKYRHHSDQDDIET